LQGAVPGSLSAMHGTLLTTIMWWRMPKRSPLRWRKSARVQGENHRARSQKRPAVLKIDAGEPLPPPPWAIRQLKVGNGFSPSAIHSSEPHRHFLELSAPKPHHWAPPYRMTFIRRCLHQSGKFRRAPFTTCKANLVGINTAIVPNAQGIGFAIPVNTAKPLIPQCRNGRSDAATSGEHPTDHGRTRLKHFQLKDTEGALVGRRGLPGSSSHKAASSGGDVILATTKNTVKESRDLPSMVAGTPVGDEAGVTC